ncbi:MAG TPA: hypothetical protein VF459_00565 [Caulobacteraceae bacterium]
MTEAQGAALRRDSGENTSFRERHESLSDGGAHCGVVTFEDGETTGEMPGKLIRGPQTMAPSR